MQRRLILDTRNLVQTLYSHEVLDSIADPRLIVEKVFVRSPGYLFRYHEDLQLTDDETQLFNELMTRYECGIDRQYWENTYSGVSLSVYVEMILLELFRQARGIMHNALKFLSYEPVPNTILWVGDDLSFVVNIHELNFSR